MKIRSIRFSLYFLAILFWTAGLGGTTENKSTITDHFFNGRMWQLLNSSQKTIHLTGIQEGILLCLSQIKEDLLIPPGLMHSMQESGMFDRRRMLFSMQGVSGISKGIDVFYHDTGNLAIPIIEAYRHVTISLNYADPQEVTQDLARLKLKYKK